MKNRIYFFTGTGNCLKAAKDIAAAIGDCELVPIKSGMGMTIPAGLERVGFVFPVYYFGPPNMVADFVKNAEFGAQGDTYFFAVATYGALPGIAVPIVRDALAEKGIKLNFGGGAKMFANGVFNYNMSQRVEKITAKSNGRIAKIMPAIVAKQHNKIRNTKQFTLDMYQKKMTGINELALEFNVNNNCNHCGLCRDICPAKNVFLESEKTAFGAKCEACLACIQRCPKQAINHTKTHERRRYQHPEIDINEVISYYKED